MLFVVSFEEQEFSILKVPFINFSSTDHGIGVGMEADCLTHIGKDFLLHFLLEDLWFQAIVYFESNFLCISFCEEQIRDHSFTYRHSAVLHQLLRRSSFLPWIVCPPWLEINWPSSCGWVSGLCILTHQSDVF